MLHNILWFIGGYLCALLSVIFAVVFGHMAARKEPPRGKAKVLYVYQRNGHC